MANSDAMNVDVVLEGLAKALPLQHRSVVEHTIVAAILTGESWFATSQQLRLCAVDELEDASHLAEKITALGGTPSAEVASMEMPADPTKAVTSLVEHETETLSALHAVIEDSGQEPRSEALEHRLEHIIMRKQEHVDTLHRILNQTDRQS
jgi:bacterioferritin